MTKPFSREIICVDESRKTRAAYGGIIDGKSLMQGSSFGFAYQAVKELRYFEKANVNCIVKVYLK